MRLYKLILLLACSAHAAFSQYMPEGFEDIYLEMPWAEFIKARPNVYPSLPTPETLKETILDPKKPMEGLMEKGNSQSFDFAFYFFKEGRLSGANFLFDTNLGLKQNILKNSLRRLGGFNNIVMSKNLKKGIIQWKKKGGVIYAFIPMNFSSSDVIKIEYKIMGSAIADLFENIRKQELKGKAIDRSAFEDFKKRITAYAEGVLAEVEAQAEVTDVPLAVVAKAEGKSADQDGEYANTEYSEATVKKTVVLVLTAIALMLGFGLFYRLKR